MTQKMDNLLMVIKNIGKRFGYCKSYIESKLESHFTNILMVWGTTEKIYDKNTYTQICTYWGRNDQEPDVVVLVINRYNSTTDMHIDTYVYTRACKDRYQVDNVAAHLAKLVHFHRDDIGNFIAHVAQTIKTLSAS